MLLAALLVPALAQAAKPGDLDRSFGTGGWVRTRIVAHDQARAVVIDPKRRIVAAGAAADLLGFGVARYKPDGRLDHSFSGNGKVAIRFAGGPGYVVNWASSVAIDSRGRVVVAGSKCNLSAPPAEGGEVLGCEYALARLKPNGSLDPSFGDGGQVTTDLGTHSGASSVAIDSRDRIIAGGVNVVRYKQDGTLDPSFGNGGVAIQDYTGAIGALAIDSRGRIVGAGLIDHSGSSFLIARFLPNGTPDPSFGPGGGWVTRPGYLATSLAIAAKHRILAAGYTLPHDGKPGGFTLALSKPNGTPATWFGNRGRVTTRWRYPHTAVARSVARDSRGRIVAVGSRGNDYALARYRPNGKLDRSFPGNGKAADRFVFPRRRHPGFVGGGAIDPRDRIVVAGGESHFLLARFIGYRRQ